MHEYPHNIKLVPKFYSLPKPKTDECYLFIKKEVFSITIPETLLPLDFKEFFTQSVLYFPPLVQYKEL